MCQDFQAVFNIGILNIGSYEIDIAISVIELAVSI